MISYYMSHCSDYVGLLKSLNSRCVVCLISVWESQCRPISFLSTSIFNAGDFPCCKHTPMQPCSVKPKAQSSSSQYRVNGYQHLDLAQVESTAWVRTFDCISTWLHGGQSASQTDRILRFMLPNIGLQQTTTKSYHTRIIFNSRQFLVKLRRFTLRICLALFVHLSTSI